MFIDLKAVDSYRECILSSTKSSLNSESLGKFFRLFQTSMLRLLKMYIAKLIMWIEGDSCKQTRHQEVQGQESPKMYGM